MDTGEVVRMMAEYYNKEMTPTQVKVYIKTLNDLPVELLSMAVEHLIKTGHPFMPRVSEIRIAAREIKRLGLFEVVDPLKLIPGAAQTEADLDERYGTVEQHKELCRLFEAGKYAEADKLQAVMGLTA
jgi:hypothetical protein